MAWIKSKTKSGLTGDYWKLTQWPPNNYLSHRCEIALFSNAQNCNPLVDIAIERKNFILHPNDIGDWNGDIRAQIYTFLSSYIFSGDETAYFSDAQQG